MRATLVKIHIAKKDLGMTDEDYRNFLSRWNATSAKELTPHQLAQALSELQKIGWKPKPTKRLGKGAPKNTNAEPGQIINKIEAILADQKLPWDYAHAIAKQMHDVNYIQWCTYDEQHAVLVALIKKQKKTRR